MPSNATTDRVDDFPTLPILNLAAAKRKHVNDPNDRLMNRTGAVLALAVGVMTAFLIVVVGRVVQLQMEPHDSVAKMVPTKGAPQTIMARRGTIVDQRGRVIAISHTAYRLIADPKEIEDLKTFSYAIGDIIGVSATKVQGLIEPRRDKRYVRLNNLLTNEQVEALSRLEMKGFFLEPRLQRDYPNGHLAGQIIGLVGDEQHGLDGLEGRLEPRLTGEHGKWYLLRDAKRQPVWTDTTAYKLPRDGEMIRLTLDLQIQQFAEEELEKSCKKFEAKRGQAIVLDAKNGHVLAMANWPFFDPNEIKKAVPALRRNGAVMDLYEPGSTMKPVVFAVATSNRFADPYELIDCTKAGRYRIPGSRRTLKDSHGIGEVTWEEVLVQSSNIGMAIVGGRMGKERIYDTIRRFGFGRVTGCGLPSEEDGIVHPLRLWKDGYSLPSVVMGQEIAVTPIQMVRAYTAFANDGRIVNPTLYAQDGSDPIVEQVIDPTTARYVRKVLRRVVTEGTGRYHANSKIYRMWGKTGTSQAADPKGGGYKPRGYVGSFICGAPLEDPKIIVMGVIHEPNWRKGYYGGTVAGPIALKVVERTLDYMKVPSDVHLDTPPEGEGPDGQFAGEVERDFGFEFDLDFVSHSN